MEDKEADWWNSDDAAGLLESLFDTLDSLSLIHIYFLESPQYYMLIQDTEFYQLSVFGSIERFRTYTRCV